MKGKSLNITEEKLNKIKEIIPEAFTENKIDFEKLKAAFGDSIEFKNERYVLNWAGKSDAFRALQSPSTDTLSPCKEESIDFDNTGNIFIEGENLEVLKVLQKSYFGKVKMIYIDPPYNTGNDDFIYPDKFSESKEEYLARIGDKDENGYMTREGLFHKNSKDNGHYHSNWLSMMYPRLFLARNLLRDDGVIFVSIDDNEVHNLRLVMNEVFGEENFVACLVYDKNRKNDAKYFSIGHEYMLVFFKNYQKIKEMDLVFRIAKEGVDEVKEAFDKLVKKYNRNWSLIQKELNVLYKKWEKDDERQPLTRFTKVDEKGPFRDDGNISWPGGGGPKYEVIHPVTKKPCKIPDGGWRYPKPSRMQEEIDKGRVVFGNDETTLPRIRRNLFEADNEVMRSVHFSYAQTATVEFNAIFENKRIFDNPKHYIDIQKLIKYITDNIEDYIILDFFAGSCTTAHAVLALNQEDGGNRKFICVQMPKKCEENTEAFKAGYKTIAEIGKERIRRVIKKIKQEQEGKLNLEGNGERDLGFKVFKLKESNFKIWRSDIETEEQLVKQMQQHLEPLDEHAKTEDVMYELLLKSGIPLTAKIEEKKGYIIVNDNEIALMLGKADDKIIKEIIVRQPRKVLTLDRLFKNNDKLKTNTALQMKDAGIEFKAV